LSGHIARLHGSDVECVSRTEEDARFVLEVPSFASFRGPFSEAVVASDAIRCWPCSFYVAASRLQENKHFASDVIFGVALGVAVPGRGFGVAIRRSF
jgi:hypothetical protein